MAGTSWPTLVPGAKAKATEVELKFDWLEGDLVAMSGGTKADITYDLGTGTFRWRYAYIGTSLLLGSASAVANTILNSSLSSSGNILKWLHANTSNTANSDALYMLSVGGASGGDPFITFNVSGVFNWSLGLDNSDSDSFKISRSTALGNTDYFILDGSGNLALGPNPVISGKISGRTTSAEDYRLLLEVANATGDPFTSLTTNSTTWSYGIDNSDSDKFKISASSALGTSDAMEISTGRFIKFPLQANFKLTNSVQQANITGDGTTVNLGFDTEYYDAGGDFASNHFVAPVAGRYLFTISFNLSGILTTHAGIYLNLGPSGGLTGQFHEVWSSLAQITTKNICYTTTQLLSAGANVYAVLQVYGGTKVIDVDDLSFSGVLLY